MTVDVAGFDIGATDRQMMAAERRQRNRRSYGPRPARGHASRVGPPRLDCAAVTVAAARRPRSYSYTPGAAIETRPSGWQRRRLPIRFASALRVGASGQTGRQSNRDSQSPGRGLHAARGPDPALPWSRVPGVKRLGAGIVPARPRGAVRSRNRLFNGADGLGLRGSTLHQVDAHGSERG